MVKKLSELYQETRRDIARKEDPQMAGMMARNLLCHFTGKSKEQLVADFEELGKTDPMFAELHRLCEKHNGLWNGEAEKYLLANAKAI